MLNVFYATLKGMFRDRVFHGILMSAAIFLLIPAGSVLSMRQVTELSVTLSLSLISFILLLLAVFLGGTAIWKDIERRYTFSVLGLPITRGSYLVGKFAGVAGVVLLTAFLLGVLAFAVIVYVSSAYPPDRPLVWSYIYLAVLFDALKYMLLVSFAFLFSTVSTSFFLPVFGTIVTFLVGSASQEVYDYATSAAGQALAPGLRSAVSALYYLLPNFSAFDLKVNAIYAVAPAPEGILLTLGYFVVYTAAVLALSCVIFSRREMK